MSKRLGKVSACEASTLPDKKQKRVSSLKPTPLDRVVINQLMPGQTQRSHEENQERAYIAASRRTDRTIEARLPSAKIASDLHKKRTGRGFNDHPRRL